MTRFRPENFRVIRTALRKIGSGIRAVREVSQIRPTSREDSFYFGEYLQSQKEALSDKGSEMGLAITLFALVVSTRAERVIEIGRFKGFSTLALASGLRFIDWGWEEPPTSLQRSHEIDYARLHEPKDRKVYSVDSGPKIQAEDLIEKNNLSHYVEFIDADSRDLNLDLTADVLLIDADHSYEGCRGDVDKYVSNNLRSGGYFILHDYFRYYDKNNINRSPVKIVCDELVAEQKYQGILIDTHYTSFMVLRKV